MNMLFCFMMQKILAGVNTNSMYDATLVFEDEVIPEWVEIRPPKNQEASFPENSNGYDTVHVYGRRHVVDLDSRHVKYFFSYTKYIKETLGEKIRVRRSNEHKTSPNTINRNEDERISNQNSNNEEGEEEREKMLYSPDVDIEGKEVTLVVPDLPHNKGSTEYLNTFKKQKFYVEDVVKINEPTKMASLGHANKTNEGKECDSSLEKQTEYLDPKGYTIKGTDTGKSSCNSSVKSFNQHDDVSVNKKKSKKKEKEKNNRDQEKGGTWNWRLFSKKKSTDPNATNNASKEFLENEIKESEENLREENGFEFVQVNRKDKSKTLPNINKTNTEGKRIPLHGSLHELDTTNKESTSNDLPEENNQKGSNLSISKNDDSDKQINAENTNYQKNLQLAVQKGNETILKSDISPSLNDNEKQDNNLEPKKSEESQMHKDEAKNSESSNASFEKGQKADESKETENSNGNTLKEKKKKKNKGIFGLLGISKKVTSTENISNSNSIASQCPEIISESNVEDPKCNENKTDCDKKIIFDLKDEIDNLKKRMDTIEKDKSPFIVIKPTCEQEKDEMYAQNKQNEVIRHLDTILNAEKGETESFDLVSDKRESIIKTENKVFNFGQENNNEIISEKKINDYILTSPINDLKIPEKYEDKEINQKTVDENTTDLKEASIKNIFKEVEVKHSSDQSLDEFIQNEKACNFKQDAGELVEQNCVVGKNIEENLDKNFSSQPQEINDKMDSYFVYQGASMGENYGKDVEDHNVHPDNEVGASFEHVKVAERVKSIEDKRSKIPIRIHDNESVSF